MNLSDIGKQVESLRERIGEIKNRREDYGISNILATAIVQRRHLWIVEEFTSEIEEREGLVMEDAAKDYLNELINRNVIQIVDSYCDGRVKACRVCDLVRDLAVPKAMEEKLLGIFVSSKNHPSPVHLLRKKPRHAIYNGIGKYLKLIGPNFDNSMLPLLATTGKIITGLVGLEIKLISETLKYLKVLDISSSSEVIPEEIGNLVLLKYLGVTSCTNLDSIANLRSLQTFIFMLFSFEFNRQASFFLQTSQQ
ncbi:hypothetical protein ACET3Z_013760 [Daucus carota]